MGIPVFILGESGSGKTAALRNFGENEIILFNVGKKRLPFRKKFNYTADESKYFPILSSLKKNNALAYVVDDSQYLMAFEYFNRSSETGYSKFTDIAVHFKQLVDTVINDTNQDTIVYFLHHTEKTEHGLKAKTIGKMLDEKITLEGLFTIVLRTQVENGNYQFVTQTNGMDTIKSPMEMFDLSLDNDLKQVDSIIREYYDLKPLHDIKMIGEERHAAHC